MLKAAALTLSLTLATTAMAMAASGWTTGSVNFRDGPGAYYAKLGAIARCVQVEIDRSESGWYRVYWNGRWGWVSARYLTSDSGYCRGYNQPSGGYSRPSSGY